MNRRQISNWSAWVVCFVAAIGLFVLCIRTCTRSAVPEFDAKDAEETKSIPKIESKLTLSQAPHRFGITGGLPDGGGVFPNHVSGDDLFYFGGGIDGPFSTTPDSGTCGIVTPIQRDMYYTNLSGNCPINSNGWKIYVSGTIDFG